MVDEKTYVGKEENKCISLHDSPIFGRTNTSAERDVMAF